MEINWQALANEDFCYLTTVGRVTGHPHTIEIWFVLHNQTVYMLAGGREKADWVKNARFTSFVTVRIQEQQFSGQARILSQEVDPQEDTLARELIAAKYPSTPDEDLTEWYQSSLPVAVDLDI